MRGQATAARGDHDTAATITAAVQRRVAARVTIGTIILVACIAGLLASTLGAVLRPAPVLASCAAAPAPVDEAVLLGDVVFVGTVLRTDNQGRWATVRVEERWKGSRDLADTVEVRGGPEPGAATSVDRTYSSGRYLFIVEPGVGGLLADSACTGTQPWTDALAAFRPAGVPPAAVALPTDPLGSLDPVTIAVIAGLGVALLTAIVAYLWVLRSRRRPPDWIR